MSPQLTPYIDMFERAVCELQGPPIDILADIDNF